MSITQLVKTDFNERQYADGVFIWLTGGTVHDFQPADKQQGYHDACNGMQPAEKQYWWNYCINTLGYVDPTPHWSDRHCGGEIL